MERSTQDNPACALLLLRLRPPESLTQSESRIVFESLPIDDPQRRQPDIAAAREKLEWYPQVCLEKGLVKMLPYFRSLCRNPHEL
jgi:nucleoside-diphosphate-sugar epimerase